MNELVNDWKKSDQRMNEQTKKTNAEKGIKDKQVGAQTQTQTQWLDQYIY